MNLFRRQSENLCIIELKPKKEGRKLPKNQIKHIQDPEAKKVTKIPCNFEIWSQKYMAIVKKSLPINKIPCNFEI